MIVKNGQVYHLYKGFYKPAQLYLGDKKVAGYNVQTFTGNPLTLNGTYDDYFSQLLIAGQTKQDGTGNPSPSNIRPIRGVTKVTINGVDYVFPREIFDGDSYYYIPAHGTAQRNKAIFDGSSDEGWKINLESTNTISFSVGNLNGIMNDTDRQCDRFKCYDWNTLGGVDAEGFWTATSSNGVKILKSRLSGWSDSWNGAQKIAAFKAWLSANAVSIVYKNVTPQTITGTPILVPTYPRQTNVSADGGSITASAKIVI